MSEPALTLRAVPIGLHGVSRAVRVIALMISSLLRRQLARAGISVSLARMLDRLAQVREVSLLYQDAEANSPRTQTILSDMDDKQNKIIADLDLTQFRAA